MERGPHAGSMFHVEHHWGPNPMFPHVEHPAPRRTAPVSRPQNQRKLFALDAEDGDMRREV